MKATFALLATTEVHNWVRKLAWQIHLHLRLNHELSEHFGHTQAAYDGSAYHFHMTVMMGGQPIDVYRRIYSDISDRSIDLRYTVRELALFVYDEPMGPNGEYLAYKIVPIGR
jgi:hypothetical protein